MRELVPNARRVGYFGPKSLAGAPVARAYKDAARQIGLVMVEAYLDSPVSEDGYRRAFAELGAKGVDALVPGSGSENLNNLPTIIKFAEQDRLPAIFGATRAADMGGLAALTFGSIADSARIIAEYVHRVLKGETPGDLPFHQPTTVTITINLKAAKTIGLTIPESLLIRADEVIE